MQSKYVEGFEIGVILVIGVIVAAYFVDNYVFFPIFTKPSPPIQPYIPIEFVVTAVLAIAAILGLMADHFLRFHRWDAVRYVVIVTALLVLVTASWSIIYYNGERLHAPYGSFESIEVSVLYRGPTEVGIVVKNVGTFDTKITDILVDGKSLSEANCTSDLKIPFTVKVDASEAIGLHFTPALKLGSLHRIVFRTMTGTDYPIDVTIP